MRHARDDGIGSYSSTGSSTLGLQHNTIVGAGGPGLGTESAVVSDSGVFQLRWTRLNGIGHMPGEGSSTAKERCVVEGQENVEDNPVVVDVTA